MISHTDMAKYTFGTKNKLFLVRDCLGLSRLYERLSTVEVFTLCNRKYMMISAVLQVNMLP